MWYIVYFFEYVPIYLIDQIGTYRNGSKYWLHVVFSHPPSFYIKKIDRNFQNLIFLIPKKLIEFALDFQLPKNFPIFFLQKTQKFPKKKKHTYWLASCAFDSKITNSSSIMCELPNTTYHSWDHMKTSPWHMPSSSYIVMSVTNLRCKKFGNYNIMSVIEKGAEWKGEMREWYLKNLWGFRVGRGRGLVLNWSSKIRWSQVWVQKNWVSCAH
jgi:hypothetical protein